MKPKTRPKPGPRFGVPIDSNEDDQRQTWAEFMASLPDDEAKQTLEKPATLASNAVQAKFSSAKPPRNLPLIFCKSVRPILSNLSLVKGLLASTGMAILFGHPGCGKSFAAIDLGCHVALGWDWAGRKVTQGAVVYLAAEGGRGVQNRIAAFKKHHGVDDFPFALIPCPIDLQAAQGDVNALSQSIQQVASHYRNRVALIIVDTLSKTFGAGKENSDDMAGYVNNCQTIATEHDCCVIAVHHRPKDALSSEPRGHSSLKGGVDTVLMIDGADIKRVTVGKQKDAEEAPPFNFKLLSVTIGHDVDGDAVTSCVVQFCDAAEPADEPSSDQLEAVKNIIASGEWRHHRNAGAQWAGTAIITALGLEGESVTMRAERILAKWIESGDLIKVLKRDTMKGRDVPFVEVSLANWKQS